ncbi:MAG: ice-binding family protein [Clostridium sp.]|uniref:ice-binding family protein n=1 Tax=Clostridium sp. TaxID=1506 RepID=UPI003D6C76AD
MKNKSFKSLLTFFLTTVLVLLSVNSTSGSANAQTLPIASPTKIVATAGDSQINLTWSSVQGADYYNVFISQDGLIYNSISVPETVTTTGYNVTGLTNDKLYYFKISAANTYEESVYSNVTSQTPSVRTAPVNLGEANNYAILAKTGISTVPKSDITGNIGVSPIDSTAITGFSLILDSTTAFSRSTQLVGKAYAADYASPTPSNLTTAVSNMETAYTDAAGRAPGHTELYTGDISGQTLTSGVYKWGTGVLINSNVTLSGGANDVFIFQVAKGITQASGTNIILEGGVQAKNIFWQVAQTVKIKSDAHFEGIILGKTNIALGAKASINGRLLAQTAVTLIKNTVVAPAETVATSSVTTMEELQIAIDAGITDITIVSSIPTGMSTVVIPSGTVLRDYFKIGFGNKIIVKEGGSLRLGAEAVNNLIVGSVNSSANLKLENNSTFTINGDINDRILTYTLNGEAMVQQQNTNPFVVAENETFIVATGATLNIATATDTDIENVQPVLSVNAAGGKLVVNGTLNLLSGSRIFLGDGVNSITNTGTINNNSGTYDGSIIIGIVGILDLNHNVIDV